MNEPASMTRKARALPPPVAAQRVESPTVSSQKVAGKVESAKHPTAGDEPREEFASRGEGGRPATGRVPPFIEKLRPTNVILTGIGGQGVITAATIFRAALVRSGLRLTGQDNRGGAQRLGHVSAFLRFVENEDYPMGSDIPAKNCDLMISMEMSEGLRYYPLLGKDTTIVVGSRLVVPTNQRRRKEKYISRQDCRSEYLKVVGRFREIDADAIAHDRWGNSVLGNFILLGAGLSTLQMNDTIKLISNSLEGYSREAFQVGLESMEGVK